MSTDYTGWEKELLADCLEFFRAAANHQLRDGLGPEPRMTKSDYLRLERVADELKGTIRQEYGGFIATTRRKIWPFNDDSVSIPPMFESVYMSILENDLIGKTDADTKRITEQAGGRPYRAEGYGGNDYGDAVVRPNKVAISTVVGCSVRTVERRIAMMAKSAVLIPLATHRNKPRLYVIGTLQRYMGNNIKVAPVINRTANRDRIRAALASL